MLKFLTCLKRLVIMQNFYLYDSVKKNKILFEPIFPKRVTLYVCGPTVYDNSHLGHARSALAFDLLVRTLETIGYEVIFAKNFTDIDDKIIKKVKESGNDMATLTKFYIQTYLEEMSALNIKRASIEPKATESLNDIIKMIELLIDKGFAYKTSNSDVYFDTTKDPLYGTLSNKTQEETQERVTHSKEKKSDKDYALWKGCKEEPCFDAPFGKGRPGWHIECSAMIEKYFKEYSNKEFNIDIHGGGADLLFPHHENEASQSRCATDKTLAKYWLHNGFIKIDGEKMSKSLGNSFFLKDALKVYDGEVLRYYLNSIHYRNDFNFNEEDLISSKKRLDKLYRLKKRVYPIKASAPNKEFKKTLLEAMCDDLNISIALSNIDEMLSTTNEELDKNPKNKALKKETIANIELIEKLLGFGGLEPFSYFQIGVDKETKDKIDKLIEKRDIAKKEKDYSTSDKIREELLKMDISIMDTPNGTVWEKSI